MDLERALRTHGHRVTEPRRVVWEVLSATDGHLNAQEIAELVRARDSGINVSSVYRTLTLLTDLALVRESRLGDEASTWEVAHPDDAIHLVCSRCGTVRHHHTELIEDLRHQLAGRGGFRTASIDVRVDGHCLTCAEPDD